MNRRTFLRTLLGLPLAGKVALSYTASPKWSGSSTDPKVNEAAEKMIMFGTLDGVDHSMFRMWSKGPKPRYDYMCGPTQATELNEVFKKLYDQRRDRQKTIEMIVHEDDYEAITAAFRKLA